MSDNDKRTADLAARVQAMGDAATVQPEDLLRQRGIKARRLPMVSEHTKAMRARTNKVVPYAEMKALLDSIAAGGSPIAAVGRSWEQTAAGDVCFRVTAGPFAGWVVVIFNDSQSFDYVDTIRAPDGRFTEYDDMYRADDLAAPEYARWWLMEDHHGRDTEQRCTLFDCWECDYEMLVAAPVVPV